MTTAHPFGREITPAALAETFEQAHSFEDKYRLLIQTGKKLPALPEALRQPEIEISGCENRVWLGHQRQADGSLHFFGDSEGRIVRGLLAVLLTAIEGQTPAQIAAHDPWEWFKQLGLDGQLSASRSQGLAALITAVKQAN